MKLYSKIFVFTAFALLTAGCSQKVEIQALAPAQVSQIATAKRIAVIPFKHDRVGLSGRIESLIANQRVGGVPYFTLVSRTNINKVIAEQKLQSSQLVDADTATKVGELIGAQALVTGSVSTQNATSRRYYKDRRECLSFSKKSGECLRWHFYQVACNVTKATVSANINIVSIETGSIIYGDTLSKNYSADSCNDLGLGLISIDMGPRSVLSRSQAINTLTSQIAHEFVDKLTPHYVHFEVELLDSIKIDATSKQEKELKNALLYIKAGRLHKADQILSKLMADLQGKSYVVAYDAGVVNEALGRLDKAKELYDIADNLTNHPIKALDDALVRIHKLIAKRDLAMSQINAK